MTSTRKKSVKRIIDLSPPPKSNDDELTKSVTPGTPAATPGETPTPRGETAAKTPGETRNQVRKLNPFRFLTCCVLPSEPEERQSLMPTKK